MTRKTVIKQWMWFYIVRHKQESPAVADKSARSESMKKTAPVRRAYCLQRCRWQYWSIFIRLAVIASEICEIPRNSLKIQLIEFKVIQGHLGVNRKRICNFLLVINSNFGRISYSFRYIDTFNYKIACFPHCFPTIVWRRLAEERLALST